MDNFNPRSPHGERLYAATIIMAAVIISIHAPRMGSDIAFTPYTDFKIIISIHAPRMGSDEN